MAPSGAYATKYQFVCCFTCPDQGRHGKQRLPDRDYMTTSHWRVGLRTAHGGTPGFGVEAAAQRVLPDTGSTRERFAAGQRSAANGGLDYNRPGDWQIVGGERSK